MSIIKLKAPTKDYIWGGQKLKNFFGKQSDTQNIAESWELSCHKDGESIIENGEGKGQLLSEFIKTNPQKILGENCEKFENFPILIKLIDAQDNLSVQVHPDNDYALSHENEYGKTEMWYIVDCEKDAELIFGFEKEISKQDFENHIKNGTLLDVVKKVKVQKGDTFFISAGTLHAIGKGIVIAEIQQNSNTTYRVYDYGRVDANGNSRELHIQKAVDVTNLTPAQNSEKSPNISLDGYTKTKLADCEYFKTFLLEVETSAKLFADEKSFHSILVINGEGEISSKDTTLKFKKGDSFIIPANSQEYEISGECVCIQTTI